MEIFRELGEARKTDGSGIGDRLFRADAEKNDGAAEVGSDGSIQRHLTRQLKRSSR